MKKSIDTLKMAALSGLINNSNINPTPIQNTIHEITR